MCPCEILNHLARQPASLSNCQPQVEFALKFMLNCENLKLKPTFAFPTYQKLLGLNLLGLNLDNWLPGVKVTNDKCLLV